MIYLPFEISMGIPVDNKSLIPSHIQGLFRDFALRRADIEELLGFA